jgi:16S rRNA processing protein RimM
VPGAMFTVGTGPSTVTVTNVRPHNIGLILGFAEVADRAEAEAIAKSTLTIPASERRELEPDEFWPDDLLGLDVVDPEGGSLGLVVDVVVGAAQDRLVVETPSGHRVEVPFVAALVDEPAGGSVVIRPPAGLFDAPDR